MLFESLMTSKHEHSCITTGIASKIHIGLVLGRRGTHYGEIRMWIEKKWKDTSILYQDPENELVVIDYSQLYPKSISNSETLYYSA